MMDNDQEAICPAFENHDYYVELGEHISFYRKRARISQTELARRINISRTYLCRIEKANDSRFFSLEILFNICRELGIEPRCLFEPFPLPEENKKKKKRKKK